VSGNAVPVEPDRDLTRVVTCDLLFDVTDRAEIAVQIVAADSAGLVRSERFEVVGNGGPPVSLEEIRNPQGERIHVILADPGPLSISYRSELLAHPHDAPLTGTSKDGPPFFRYERQLYLRPSRYCPSDHLIGFAMSEFRSEADIASRVATITQWIRERIAYVPGSSDVHDSAEHTLLTGMGTCRDFAHLGIALCRATGVPARFAAVYAPGLSPMDFHAVFETLLVGRWTVHDATGLAPRASLVRIATGRDAADAAFSAVNVGVVELGSLEVSATVGSVLPRDDPSALYELA
jgi:transglutaminase-like putative cysteine protease